MLDERTIQAAVRSKPGTNWKQVTPEARKRLQPLVSHYRKSPKPFTQCVADNTKRFGPEGAKRICAVVKDLIEKRTTWRKGPKKVKASGDDMIDRLVEAAGGDVDGLVEYLEHSINVERQIEAAMGRNS